MSGRENPRGDEVELWLEYFDPQLSQLDLRLTGAWHGDRLELRPERKNPFAPDDRFVPNRPLSTAGPSDYLRAVELRKNTVAALSPDCATWGEP